MVELLKQPQYQPVPVEKQVVVIYAATNGHLDEVAHVGDRGSLPLLVAVRLEGEAQGLGELRAFLVGHPGILRSSGMVS